MYTYQDLEEVLEKNSETETMKFVRDVIVKHEASDDFKIAKDAREYFKHKNVTINNFQKLLYTVTGKAIPDNYSANFKMASKYFYRFVTQENQYLLGNGATWEKSSTKDKLGTRKYPFDTQLQIAGREALIEKVAFCFWNLDHVEVFKFTEFAPLFDERTGALRAGVRFWQIDKNKPLRATLYEEDGYTEYIWTDRTKVDAGEILQDKTPYVLNTRTTEADGIEIIDGQNYPSFPIIPLYGNSSKQSELVGMREQIDCYDLIKSGFANTVDEASLIYWTLNNAGGMDDIDLVQFVERIRSLHAAAMEDGVNAEPHSIEAPYASREALLDRLRSDMYEDAMALDTKALASGGSVVTAVIKAAYEPLDDKCDEYEYQITQFIDALLELTGIDDNATFTRSKIINASEDIATVLSARDYLSEEYVTKKILTLLGDGDQADDILKNLDSEALERFNSINNQGNGKNATESELGASGTASEE